jgi:DNA-nicking Smr family endonuclease
MADEDSQPIAVPIDGVLDLHTFRPQDVKNVLHDFLELCQEQGIYELRIIHGKGIGQLRNTVHAILNHHLMVHSYALAGEAYGGSGATIVHLRPVSGP